ncbi:potassium transporter Kup [Chromatium okenii]|uniref:Probable potassium transport system protein Kup n=1 Tax=Chromatium okenii TaxID=61644 RepID=A0A2S7XS17_9GAMM|nr:potassium transporter Kup [Chromatium okenii]PQJ96520.1 potassium transporter Kup [Chromatium okenii]
MNLSSPALAPRARLGVLSMAALGIVYGDIGTSPLYAIKTVFANDRHPVPVDAENILGVLSLVFWSLLIVVTLKYVVLILRADNRGEGGIMALIALVQRRIANQPIGQRLILLGLFGAALFYGDGIITPAISVLSAVEGLKMVTPDLEEWILPITLAILCGLFAVQRHGTAQVGNWFGPIMAIWFLTLAVLGIDGIIAEPAVLAALSPIYALNFFVAHPALAFFSLGSIVLAVTGTEALYADMGHFGRGPVQLAWGALVLPALTLNYFGQGALLLAQPQTVTDPFFHLAPAWALLPLVLLATVATVIASQAVISGAFSMTRQAIQLGYLPRMVVQHTSSAERGQIYVPAINWLLFIAVIALVLSFGSSDKLAAAYGVAVTGTMSITTVLVFVVARRRWRWGSVRTFTVLGLFLAIDLAFFAANLPKLSEGGWFPLVFAALVFVLMSTWKRGRALILERLTHNSLPLAEFMAQIEAANIPTVSGTAVYLSARSRQVPHALLHSLKHFKCLHERVVILHLAVLSKPYIAADKRMRIDSISPRFYQAHMEFGFMDTLNVAEATHLCQNQDVNCDPANTTFFLGRETLVPTQGAAMAIWRQKLFIALFRNASSPTAYFGLPPNRVVELGAQVQL